MLTLNNIEMTEEQFLEKCKDINTCSKFTIEAQKALFEYINCYKSTEFDKSLFWGWEEFEGNTTDTIEEHELYNNSYEQIELPTGNFLLLL